MENNVNILVLQGGVVREPELVYTASGLAKSTFPIANNCVAFKSGTKEQEVNYFDVVAWGKLAEICGTYLKKGTRVIISGKLRQSRWKNDEGKTRTRVSIIAQDIKFLPGNRNPGYSPQRAKASHQA
ncbi:MAG: single-stranded DNA-binding protein [Brevinematales bacterium]|nr:single-stranded DNA-binding protein [Brevinematales bacterium]